MDISLDNIAVPKDKTTIFALVKSFCSPFIKSVKVVKIDFSDSEYAVVVGFKFLPVIQDEPIFEFCFNFDDALLCYFREVN